MDAIDKTLLKEILNVKTLMTYFWQKENKEMTEREGERKRKRIGACNTFKETFFIYSFH